MEVVSTKQQKRRLNFYDCFKPIFTISHTLGLLSYTIHSDPSGTPDSTTVGVINATHLIGSILLNFLLAHVYQLSPRRRMGSGSAISILSSFYRNCRHFILFLSVVLDLLNRNRLLKILKNFIVFDKNVIYFTKTL